MSQGDRSIVRRRFLKYGGTLGGAALIAGCTGDDGTTGNTTTTADDGDDDGGDETTTTADDGGDDNGESLVNTYATIVRPSSVDPHKSTDELEGILNHTVYDPLAYYSYDYPPEVRPWVAADWTASDDGQTYTFDIREGIEFHNGDTLTAEDVVFSIERQLTMGTGPAWMWSAVMGPDSATAVDDTTVELQLNRPYGPFEATLPWLFIVNSNQITDNEADGDYGDHGDYATQWLEENDAGSGAYALKDRSRGTEIQLERHEAGWQEFASQGDIYDEIHLDLAQEVSTIVGNMRNADATMTDGWLSVDTYNQLGQEDTIEVSEEVTFIKPFYVYMNVQKEPLDDVHVRKALSYAFDYETAVSDVLVGAQKLDSPLPEGFDHYTTDGVEQYSLDMEEAQAQLDQASYSRDEISVTYTYVSGLTTEENLGLMMQSNYNQLDIDFEIEVQPWTKIVDRATNVDDAPQMFPLWNNTVYRDPDAIMYGMWHSDNLDSYLNGSKFDDEEIDSLLEEGRFTADPDSRADIYEELQRRIADEAGAIFCCLDVARWANNASLQGFVNNGINGYTHQFHQYYRE